MFISKVIFGKLSTAVQTVLAFALMIVGVTTALNAPAFSGDDFRWLIAFLLIALLYLVNGVPPFLEGAMTMIYEKSEDEKMELK